MNGMIRQTGHSLGCSVVATGKCTCGFPPPTEMASLVEIKARLAIIERQQKETQEGLLIWMEAQRKAISAIEQGQGVLCERLDGLAERLPTKLFAELASIETPLAAIHERLDTLEKMLVKPKRRRK